MSSGDVVVAGVLGQVPGRRRPLHEPGLGRVGAAEDAEQGGLARTVAPDEADLLARAHLEVDPVDDRLRADLDDEVAGDEHEGILRRRCGGPDSLPRAGAAVGRIRRALTFHGSGRRSRRFRPIPARSSLA